MNKLMSLTHLPGWNLGWWSEKYIHMYTHTQEIEKVYLIGYWKKENALSEIWISF